MYQPIAPCSAPSTKMPPSFSASGGRICGAAENRARAARNTTPISRPSRRWKYSNQKMPLNSSQAHAEVDLLVLRASAGTCERSSCHAGSESGGSVPTIGCHSTIDRPECVSRVTPPTTTIAKTRAQQSEQPARRSACVPIRRQPGCARLSKPSSEVCRAVAVTEAIVRRTGPPCCWRCESLDPISYDGTGTSCCSAFRKSLICIKSVLDGR